METRNSPAEITDMTQTGTSRNRASTNGTGSPPRVLVVDDEPYMCDVCTRTLQRGGYEVVATTDPHAAIRELQGEHHFDMLLTDIKMPEMSGLDLAHLAREKDPTIAIIIMTGFATMENIQQSVQSGIADFLSKPFELDQLRLAVDQALNKRLILQDNLRLRTLARLIDSSQPISATLELTEVADILLRVSLRESGCRTAFLLLGEAGESSATVRASDKGGELLADGLALGEAAIAQKQPLQNHDRAFARFNGDELRHALAVPLQAQGAAVGVLLLCDDRADVFRPGVQESVILLANHAGAAIRNAALYGELDKAYQRVQELDRLKSEFISIASHELRTPLSIILGYTMMVRDQTASEQRLYLERVMESAQRIKEIVDDMVSLRHLDTGDVQIAANMVSLQEMIRTAIERIRPSADAREQTIEIDIPEESLKFVCDHEKMMLILGHLLSNAVRFTPKGGRIIIRSRLQQPGQSGAPGTPTTLHVRTPSTLPWVVVEVEDNGIGIPEHEQPRIFERFYQVASSLTRDHGGTGLGLALVRELVGMLDGAVWVESAQGQGSVFAVALPFRQEAALGL